MLSYYTCGVYTWYSAAMPEDLYHLGVKALIRRTDGAILLLKLDPTFMGGEYWDLPGGRVQQGSSVQDTLRREIVEETGIRDVTIGKHVGMVLSTVRIKLKTGDEVGLILSIYECTIPNQAVIVPADGHVAYEWLVPLKAAKLMSNKYPAEFCELIVQL
jgi:8-oxo-dGTP pyrophosphatase MutT (NUDIX family)